MEPSCVDSISDDLLEAILRRLPCPACFARAAAVSRRFRTIILRPAFRRQLHSDHPFPLPGFFLDSDGTTTSHCPRFSPFGPYCGHRFSLEHLPPDVDWDLYDCRGGRLLLFSRRSDGAQFAVCDPLDSRYVVLPLLPRRFIGLPSARVIVDQDAGSLYSHVIFASGGGVVSVHRAGEPGWDEVPDPRYGYSGNELQESTFDGVLAKNIILLPCVARDHLLVFNLSAVKISTIKVPNVGTGYGRMFSVELEDERTVCVVALTLPGDEAEGLEDTELHLWRLEKGAWELSVIPLRSLHGAEELLQRGLEDSRLSIRDANNGFVFLKKGEYLGFFAIRLKTMQSFNLQLFPWGYSIPRVFPFWMPWLSEQ